MAAVFACRSERRVQKRETCACTAQTMTYETKRMRYEPKRLRFKPPLNQTIIAVDADYAAGLRSWGAPCEDDWLWGQHSKKPAEQKRR